MVMCRTKVTRGEKGVCALTLFVSWVYRGLIKVTSVIMAMYLPLTQFKVKKLPKTLVLAAFTKPFINSSQLHHICLLSPSFLISGNCTSIMKRKQKCFTELGTPADRSSKLES